MAEIVGRFAPSPTGFLHLGSARTALVAWLSVRHREGRFIMRMEDLDPPRVVPGAARSILEDLRWLGLDWDEGPEVGGPNGPYEQSLRGPIYARAVEALRESGRAYACTCSRREIAAGDSRGVNARGGSIASAPHGPEDEGPRYPGTCRSGPKHPERESAWRFRMPDSTPAFTDVICEEVRLPDGLGDFVVARADGVFAYHLAVVIDDAAMGVTEVVRGADLLSSTPRHRALQEALGLPSPTYAHVPLVRAPNGERLAKRHKSSAIRELRDAGVTPEAIVGRLAHSLGLLDRDEPVKASDVCERFSWDAITKASSNPPPTAL